MRFILEKENVEEKKVVSIKRATDGDIIFGVDDHVIAYIKESTGELFVVNYMLPKSGLTLKVLN